MQRPQRMPPGPGGFWPHFEQVGPSVVSSLTDVSFVQCNGQMQYMSPHG